jgi:uncharacterized protein YndB with AHSA1/START domain
MSTKIKASSKNKKGVAKKVVKKAVASKKVASKKIVTKSSTKNNKAVATAKKNAPKKVVKSIKKVASKAFTKKPAKKIVAKSTSKIVKKSIIKKVAKPLKKAVAKKSSIPAKKVIIKKAAKASKKQENVKVVKSLNKSTVKAEITNKPIAKSIAKKVEKSTIVKEPKVKVEKPIKEKKVKAQVVKKPIVAPTTFRKVENSTPTKVVKEPAGKFEMEFVIRASEDMVFEFVSTESGLSEWFCDDVNIRDGIFTFNWDGQIQQAKLVKEVPPISIRYQWLDKNDGSYFEFKTQKDELTNDISLIITDFATDKDDEISAKLLWHSQIDKLLHVLGSFF